MKPCDCCLENFNPHEETTCPNCRDEIQGIKQDEIEGLLSLQKGYLDRIKSLESAIQEYISDHGSENQMCGDIEPPDYDFCDRWNLKFKQLLSDKQPKE